MDVAVGSRSALVLRRMEAAAPFAGVLAVKEVKWGGLGTVWQPRHVVVMYRFPGPAAPTADRVVRKVCTVQQTPVRASVMPALRQALRSC